MSVATQTCPQCQAPVISARIKDGRGYKLISIERCEDGDGDMAIFPQLFADGHPPVAEVVCNGTSYRAHPPHGSVLAFTARVRERKRA
jgi:hypothetical protein